ncbi:MULTISPECIES: helix-turn-helix transcriptional regulator [unclassified Neisseria]|uniref:XRE family transcriptional regulator n=1 Tax=unclassified Neisseria TaxID=2623750 RepID=UPI00107214DF|nr:MULTISPECIES: helix-turn-helix transcriptional regulator [unclassified Neisseria]MBF0802932.1 helix-turn-helix transcriptional regulator [Neisseria sp. 19428wB4_WF04]TFU44461.1 XRE family transcriptional regulator [Neisseria sp. WF04]
MFGQRLKEERLKNQLSQEDLADKLDVKKNTVWNWENEKSYPNALQIMYFLDFGFDVQYILTGKKQTPDNLNDEEFTLIPFFEVEVSAGHGAYEEGVSEPSSHLAFRRDWLRTNGLHEKNLSCVMARGDSMEPTIGNRDTLLVDMSRAVPRDGHIYVIRSSDTLWVKRIQKQIDGTLLLLSDNDAYPPMPLHLDQHPDIQVIGQVVNVSRDLS